MNHLIAKAKVGRDKGYYKLISSNDEFFQLNIEDSCSYSPETLLEESQWYKIDAFSKRSYCISLLTDTWNSTSFSQLKSIDIDNIDYLCSYQSNNAYFFQRVFKKSIIRNKNLLIFGDYIILDNKHDKLVLEEVPDAVYYKDQDCLYFRKLETIAPIFRGIDTLYREATEEEVKSFLSGGFIRLEEGYSSGKVGKANRHRIAIAMSILKEMKDKQRKKLFAYTNEYYPDLKYDNNAFTIRSEQDLKNLLYGIEQRMYTTEVTNEKRAANAYIPL